MAFRSFRLLTKIFPPFFGGFFLFTKFGLSGKIPVLNTLCFVDLRGDKNVQVHARKDNAVVLAEENDGSRAGEKSQSQSQDNGESGEGLAGHVKGRRQNRNGFRD